ncbi:MAG: cpnA2 [Mycobacterium sp.]|jgi:NAD(P)-dependent dehydrogenase (short-subunit alcohol dehydrogenase family)|nr:cpnA2 [Mycobacterium sp.]
MANRLDGKVALISGSTRGIGRSIAQHFASEGAKVAVTGRTVAKGEKVVDLIRSAGGEAEFFRLDVADESSVSEVVDSVVERFGALTTLINNAAPTDIVAASYKKLHELETKEWESILLATLTGNVFWASKYAWPHLAAAQGASILNISSGQSVMGMSGLGAYGSAKGAVNSLTRHLAVEGAEDGIRANCIIVGRVVSGSGDSGRATGPGHLTRLGNPMDVAYAATWLSCDESAFVTGSLVTVDGGFTINGDAMGAQ